MIESDGGQFKSGLFQPSMTPAEHHKGSTYRYLGVELKVALTAA